MPPAPRLQQRETSLRAEETERKRARGALSCAECRRLKLKCDKGVPCSNCKRRGCESICPNGSLVTGHGTRFVLADTDRLHRKINDMSERIRQLEDALTILQSSCSKSPHPLLREDFLRIKSTIDLHSASGAGTPAVDSDSRDGHGDDSEARDTDKEIDNHGTMTVRDYGMYDVASYYGSSAGSDTMLTEKMSADTPTLMPSDLPVEITRLSEPLFSMPSVSVDEAHASLRSYLPPWAQARRLCDLYVSSSWCSCPVTPREIDDELLPLYYPEAENSNMIWNAGAVPRRFGPHRTALLFMIFCMAGHSEFSQAIEDIAPESVKWLHLARAAINLQPVFDRPPCVSTVQVLSLMAIYRGHSLEDDAIEIAWQLRGQATKMALSLGLHRDCSRFRLSPFETEKRRALFWHLCFADCMLSLATGRLPSFGKAFVDCELPLDQDATLGDDGAVQTGLHTWKAEFARDCLLPVCEGILQAAAPKYPTILELDRRVRDVPLPSYCRQDVLVAGNFQKTMLHFMPRSYRDHTLLYLHRCYFAQAVCGHPRDPLQSPYAPSFLAAYRSACNILNALKDVAEVHPAELARVSDLWAHAFSSAAMLASVVTHAPHSKVSSVALFELKQACDLFERVAPYRGRAAKFSPVLQRLLRKAEQTLATLTSAPPSLMDMFSAARRDDGADEAEYTGRVRTGRPMSGILATGETPLAGPAHYRPPDAPAALPAEHSLQETWTAFMQQLELAPTDLAYTYTGNFPATDTRYTDARGSRPESDLMQTGR